MAEIITRLLLNTKDFDAKLGRSKKEVDHFSNGLSAAGKSIGTAFKGIVGAVGVTVGSVELFKKTMASSETTNDMWENSMRAVDNVTNAFLSSITGADFSNFYQGLDTIVLKAKNTAEALRQIDDAQTVFGYTTSINRADFNEAITVMKDPKATSAEKMAAKISAGDIVNRQLEDSKVLADKAIKAASALITQTSSLAAGDVTSADIDSVLRLALSMEGNMKMEELEAAYVEYTKEAKAIRDRHTKWVDSNNINNPGRHPVAPSMKDEGFASEMTALNNKYFNALLYNAMYDKTNGADFKQLVGFLQSAHAARGEAASMQKTLLRQGASVSEAPLEGSIAFLEDKLKNLNKILITVTTDDARAAAQIAIKEVEDQIKQMKRGTRKEIEIGEARQLAPGLVEGGEDKGELKDPSKFEKPVENLNDQMNAGIEIANTFSGVLQSLTGVVDEGAAAWLSYAANLIQTIAAAIPAIKGITKAKKEEAEANLESGVAKTVDSTAGVPIVGPALAVAAVASVIAAVMAIPKFATGGVVPGTSFYGDNVLARVNSGEMILTQQQQARLLNAVDHSSRDVHVTGRLTASGRDLAVVLDNYSKYRRQ